MLFKAAGHRHHRSSQFAAGIDVFKTWLYIVHAVGPPNSILVALKLVEGPCPSGARPARGARGSVGDPRIIRMKHARMMPM